MFGSFTLRGLFGLNGIGQDRMVYFYCMKKGILSFFSRRRSRISGVFFLFGAVVLSAGALCCFGAGRGGDSDSRVGGIRPAFLVLA